ncbi:uncharacterized protein PV07_04156 [Cladophialophora immunda]|uniref:Major facilitator superfamily (MFS) profile domain-containing protein n=1 Tax=Cladophialophora immunda TaxID=569365 RepID=A0A0D2CRP9_9EURO|nr:uncharacterized protein PV07_04156 [Cladophialophora immunda]KIW32625.1 hypothetical protein PV07_04156 [Cladophialophora immunda]OQV03596.1 hypothetical protein CLAIMM_08618 [Cladophialophora immunda]
MAEEVHQDHMKTSLASDQIEIANHAVNVVRVDDEDRKDNSRDSSDLKGYFTSYRFIGSFIAINLMAQNLFFGFSMPANVLTVINAELGPSSNYTLIGLIFGLCNGVLMLIVGRLSDIIGRRYFILGSQVLGVIGPVICANATSINMVIGGTVVTGIAAGTQQLYALFLHELVPNKYRALTQSVLTVGMLPSMGFAPVIARAFVQHTALGWRWCYYLNAIVAGISFLLFLFCYFPPNFYMINSRLTRLGEFKRLDYVGFVLYTGGLVMLLLGFTWPQGSYPWKSAHVIAALAVGGCTVTAFILYELYGSPRQPLMPMKLLKIRNYSAIITVGSVGQMIYYALAILWPIQIQALYTTSNIKVGIMSCTTGLAVLVGITVTGLLFKKIGHQRWQLVAATSLLAALTASMSAATKDRQGLGIAATVIAGFAIGWLELIGLVVAGLVVPPNDIGAGQGFFGATRSVTGSLATSIYVTVYSSRLEAALPAKIVPAVVSAGLPQSSLPGLFQAISKGTPAALEKVPGINAQILGVLDNAIKAANSSALRVTYLSTLAFGGCAIISSLFVGNMNQYLTNFVNKTVQKTEFTKTEKPVTEKAWELEVSRSH